MELTRRTFLTSAATVGGAARLGQAFRPQQAQAVTTGSAGLYTPNGSGLTPSAFLRLPPDAFKAQGWLSTQLQNQLAGLNGRPDDLRVALPAAVHLRLDHAQPVRLGGGPYWLRGYANLGYVTGDQTTISTAAQWLTRTIATQQASGFFGPDNVATSLNGGFDPWPYMPMLRAVTSYAEYSGDTTAVPFLTRFFGFLAGQPTSQISNGWGYTRWAEMMDSVLWLYNRTGDSSLLSLLTRIHQNSASWMTSSLPTLHNVNLAEGFREPAVYSQLGGSSYVQGTYN